MASLLKLAPALAAALFGVFIAFLWYQAPAAGLVIGVVVVGIALVGWAAHGAGLAQRRTDPVRSVRFLEAWGLVYVAVAAIGTAVGIVLAVYLAGRTPEGTPAETKQLYTAAITALTTFVTGWLVKGLEDLDGVLAERIKGEFRDAYANCYIPAPSDPPSNAYLALYVEEAPGASGWGWSARRARAEVLAATPCWSDAG